MDFKNRLSHLDDAARNSIVFKKPDNELVPDGEYECEIASFRVYERNNTLRLMVNMDICPQAEHMGSLPSEQAYGGKRLACYYNLHEEYLYHVIGLMEMLGAKVVKERFAVLEEVFPYLVGIRVQVGRRVDENGYIQVVVRKVLAGNGRQLPCLEELEAAAARSALDSEGERNSAPEPTTSATPAAATTSPPGNAHDARVPF